MHCCILCACHVLIIISRISSRYRDITFWRQGWDFPLLIIMATFGKIDEFNMSKEERSQYMECLTQFFLANGSGEKRAV